MHQIGKEALPEFNRVDRSRELGVALGLDPPLNLIGLEVQQKGFAYADADEFNAVKVIDTFLF